MVLLGAGRLDGSERGAAPRAPSPDTRHPSIGHRTPPVGRRAHSRADVRRLASRTANTRTLPRTQHNTWRQASNLSHQRNEQ